jgi:23S rRNA pseudouridine1911/1915/1917 synthase
MQREATTWRREYSPRKELAVSGREKELCVTAEEAGMRLDALLVARYPKWSLDAVASAVRGGQVRSGEKLLQPHRIMEKDEQFIVAAPHLAPTHPLPECPPIVHEDAGVLAFNKPAGMLCHPVGSTFTWGLINIARDRFPGERLHLAHRVDRETSGVVVMARNDDLNRQLKAAFKARKVAKRYLAIVRGAVDFETEVVEAPIGRDETSPIRMKMGVVASGQSAQTRFVRKAVFGEFSLVECQPLSGRTHQIRVHLDHLGFPILGDKIYGQDPEVFLSIWEKRPLADLVVRLGHPRHCLHAAEICFDLESGPRRFSAPLAADMQALVAGVTSV